MSEGNPSVLDRLLKARGEEIRQARAALGWSQTELAERANTTQQTVDRIERGVTEKSKAAPRLREVLGLPPIVPSTTRQSISTTSTPTWTSTDSDLLNPVDEKFRSYIEDTDRHLKLQAGTHIPVYAISEDDKTQLISHRFADVIPRIYPVMNVKTAYGIISRDYAMEPVVRPGDIVVVNPNLPVIPQSEVVLSRKDGETFFVLIRSLVAETEHSWTVEQSHAGTDILDKSEWPKAELIVAKISRTR